MTGALKNKKIILDIKCHGYLVEVSVQSFILCPLFIILVRKNDFMRDIHMSHVMRKPALCHMRTTKMRSACASAQSDQRLCYSLPR